MVVGFFLNMHIFKWKEVGVGNDNYYYLESDLHHTNQSPFWTGFKKKKKKGWKDWKRLPLKKAATIEEYFLSIWLVLPKEKEGGE